MQSAVDAQHHRIVAHDGVITGSDRQQLSSVAAKAKAAMGVDGLEVLADRGYLSGEEILACERARRLSRASGPGSRRSCPSPSPPGAKVDGRFGKQDFTYIPDRDVYRCPAGRHLPKHMTTVEKGVVLHRYWDLASCQACAIKPQCTPSRERRITRWEHDAVIDAMQRRLTSRPTACAHAARSWSTPSARSKPGQAPAVCSRSG